MLIRKTLTEVSADVDVEVDGVVAVVHQVAAAHFDQRVEVVLLAVRIEHEAGNLDTDGRRRQVYRQSVSHDFARMDMSRLETHTHIHTCIRCVCINPLFNTIFQR